MKEALISNCTCPKCYSRRIDIYTINNVEINYAAICEKNKSKPENILNYLNRFKLYKFKCPDCGKTFNIDWRWGLPFPSTEHIG